MNIGIELTKKGYPAIWEQGGGLTNTGTATLVSDHNGKPKSPVYVRARGNLANSQHGLFIIEKGSLIIVADHQRNDFTIKVYRVYNINMKAKFAEMVLESEFSKGEWSDDDVALEFKDLIDKAKEKATCYHCRHIHYRTLEAR